MSVYITNHLDSARVSLCLSLFNCRTCITTTLGKQFDMLPNMTFIIITAKCLVYGKYLFIPELYNRTWSGAPLHKASARDEDLTEGFATLLWILGQGRL